MNLQINDVSDFLKNGISIIDMKKKIAAVLAFSTSLSPEDRSNLNKINLALSLINKDEIR